MGPSCCTVWALRTGLQRSACATTQPALSHCNGCSVSPLNTYSLSITIDRPLPRRQTPKPPPTQDCHPKAHRRADPPPHPGEEDSDFESTPKRRRLLERGASAEERKREGEKPKEEEKKEEEKRKEERKKEEEEKDKEKRDKEKEADEATTRPDPDGRAIAEGEGE